MSPNCDTLFDELQSRLTRDAADRIGGRPPSAERLAHISRIKAAADALHGDLTEGLRALGLMFGDAYQSEEFAPDRDTVTSYHYLVRRIGELAKQMERIASEAVAAGGYDALLDAYMQDIEVRRGDLGLACSDATTARQADADHNQGVCLSG
jgi:hypothetical protein